MNTRKLKRFLVSCGRDPFPWTTVDEERVVAFRAAPQTLIGIVREMALSDDFNDVCPVSVGDDTFAFREFEWEEDLPADKPEIAATNTFGVLSHVNWELLERQKVALADKYPAASLHILAGLVRLIDEIRAAAIADGILDEKVGL